MREEYSRRLQGRQAAAARHDTGSRTIGNLRLLTVLGGFVLAWYDFRLLPVPVTAFVALLLWHERVTRKASAERRAVSFYGRALARLDGKWAGTGESGSRFRDAAHPYAEDLDLFGDGSVFQLLNSARTAAGENSLADWLKAPASASEVRRRQAAVDELRNKLDFREDLALLGEDVRAALHPATLLAWGTAPPFPIRSIHRIITGGISIALLVTFSGWMLEFWPLWPMLIVILAELLWIMMMRRTVASILAGMELPGRDLGILSGLLRRVEAEPFESELLRSLRSRMNTKGQSPASQIAKLQRLIVLRDQGRNQIFAVVAEPLLWSVHFALAIERWRQKSGSQLGEWLSGIGELEALISIAAYAAEHPHDVFPELADDPLLFAGEGIAHPLLSEAAVRNDVRLDGSLRLLLVSGSNMSGKSTLLRAVGLNTVLAWAGAPVRAHKLRISRLCTGASIRVQDSLLDGKSRFYAEITRLRQIVDMAGEPVPLLFLLDELLSGTNSHDRLIGSEAVVRSLVRKGALGLVTTHDLGLASIAAELAPAAANVHFEDHIQEGSIAFDYRMRPGVVTRSNAVELMRSVGLEV